ncbi:adaptor protein MecA [Alicyclobacillus shizuokensis]|uniref:adaptor protein MecA n=1 Tax=Alicyclobacillus shizuokensis TaxID=392014 RepID=UPI000831096D|nr:adaptor protein MecA [Alicyclobacillus shizuokensis]MCL6625042.1 adaptor protein MecA [Alicyclobacillus shizuokensis]
MRVERIAKDKVRIFVSYDDLEERGIDRDEIWKNGRKVQELFWDIMETAYTEVGFEIAGPIAVEAFTMPTEGVVVIVTRVPSLPAPDEDEEEMDVELTPDVFSSFAFGFEDFEDVVRAAHAIWPNYDVGGTLYEYKGKYHLYFDEDRLAEEDYDPLWALLHEFGEFSDTTYAVLEEYGNCILRDNAIADLVRLFPLYT